MKKINLQTVLLLTGIFSLFTSSPLRAKPTGHDAAVWTDDETVAVVDGDDVVKPNDERRLEERRTEERRIEERKVARHTPGRDDDRLELAEVKSRFKGIKIEIDPESGQVQMWGKLPDSCSKHFEVRAIEPGSDRHAGFEVLDRTGEGRRCMKDLGSYSCKTTKCRDFNELRLRDPDHYATRLRARGDIHNHRFGLTVRDPANRHPRWSRQGEIDIDILENGHSHRRRVDVVEDDERVAVRTPRHEETEVVEEIVYVVDQPACSSCSNHGGGGGQRLVRVPVQTLPQRRLIREPSLGGCSSCGLGNNNNGLIRQIPVPLPRRTGCSSCALNGGGLGGQRILPFPIQRPMPMPIQSGCSSCRLGGSPFGGGFAPTMMQPPQQIQYLTPAAQFPFSSGGLAGYSPLYARPTAARNQFNLGVGFSWGG